MSKSPTSSAGLPQLFDQFIAGTTLKSVLNSFRRICQILELKPGAFNNFYPALKKGIAGDRLNKAWKSQSIFLKIDRKATSKIYQNSGNNNPSRNITSNGSHHTSTSNSNCVLQKHNCLIIGGGPCGLRTAIELQLLGANHVVIVEKRDRFSRNNVLHLWPFVISDLKQLAGKKFYGKFCAGSIDHVSIRQLQLMLIKLALIIGCEFIENITFEEICPRNVTSNKSSSRQTSPSGSASPTTPTCKRKMSFCYEKENVDGNCISAVPEEEEGTNEATSKEADRQTCSFFATDKRKDSEELSEKSDQEMRQTHIDCHCCCHRHRRVPASESWTGINDSYVGAFAHFSVTSGNPLTASACVDYNSLLKKLHTYPFNILIGADGRRNTLTDFFPRKEFRGKLAIAITANFINNHTLAEAQIPEISGISFIYNQQLFKALLEETGIDLENICYYKDDTHYFVMTAKKSSLLARGVLLNDYPDTRALLAPNNINRNQLLNYAKDAARWTTGYEPLNFALNHYGEADVAMFDFTSMYAAENACRAKRIVRYPSISCVCDTSNHSLTGHQQLPCKKIKSDSTKNSIEDEGLLLISLVGDSLLEPFWPTGSGCGRGFLSSMDAAWLIRQWSTHRCRTLEDEEEILRVLSERESIYRLLGQTKSENLSQNYAAYTINPITRYPNLNTNTLMPHQCKYLLYEDPFPSPEMRRKRNLAFKRLRRATIATTTPFTGEVVTEQIKTEDTYFNNENDSVVQSYEESLAAFEENYQGLLSNDENSSNIMSTSVPSGNRFVQQAAYDLSMSPSATTMAQLGKSRAKDIETALRHRRQREQLLRITKPEDSHQTHKKAQQQYINHMQQQLKSKAAWLMDENNMCRSSTSEEGKPPSRGRFSSRVKDLEAKLYAASGLSYLDDHHKNVEKAIRLPSTKSGSHVMATASVLQQLFDPKNQEKMLKEQVRKKMEKEIKFVGKIASEDWNVKCWEEKQKVMPAPTTKSPEPRPKERVELFQQHLSDIQTKLANIDEKHKPIRKERNDETDGEWINMLKGELKDRSLNSKDSKNTQEIKENIAVKDTHKAREDKKQAKLCSKCHNPVATVDKIVLNNLVLHRGCLTCNRCGTMLRLSEIRSKTVTECLSVNKRGKEEANNLDYLCILCCKNKVNNNSNNNVSERMISSFEDKPTMKKAPLTPPPSLPTNNTLSPTNVDKYESRLKERMKWKEIFLLNNNDIDLRSKEPKSEELIPKIDNSNKEEENKGTTPEPKRLLNERIEYENTSISFELYDEDELTKLLNLESDQWDSEEDETETSGSWEESDSTDNDFDSDEFDMSDNLDANNSKVANGRKKVDSTIEVVSKADSESSTTEKMTEKSEKKERPMLTIELKKEESDHSNGSIDNEIEDIATPVNAIKEFNIVLRKMDCRDDKASDSDATISSVSFKGSSHFEDINLISVIDGEDESPPVKKDVKPPTPTAFSKLQSPKQTYFKVDLPKLSVFNFDNYRPFDDVKPGVLTSASTTAITSTSVKPASTTTYSKIPVLSTRIAAANATTNNSSTQRLPTYSGSFTEKLLQRCRSTPALSNKDAFTRWGTQSSLLTAGTPNSPSNKLCFEKRLSFPPKNKETKISPETPSISKLPFADSETNVDDLRSPRLVNVQSPKRQPQEAAPRACIDEAFEEDDKFSKDSRPDNIRDNHRHWIHLKHKD